MSEQIERNLTFIELMKFVSWEVARLDAASKSATRNERILWASTKIAEETGEACSDVLTYLGLAREGKLNYSFLRE